MHAKRNPLGPVPPDPFGYFHATTGVYSTNYGCEGLFNVWNPSINSLVSPGDDHSISQTWIQCNQPIQQIQSLKAGWTVDTGLNNGSAATHLFTFFITRGYPGNDGYNNSDGVLLAIGDYLGGYNQLEKGWVQIDTNIYPGAQLNDCSAPGGKQVELGIKYQLVQGNWWLAVTNSTGAWTWIGYYPGRMFASTNPEAITLDKQVDWISFGGEVYSGLADPSSTSDQMGGGYQAAKGFGYAAYQRNLGQQSEVDASTASTSPKPPPATIGQMIDYSGSPETDSASANCSGNSYTILPSMTSGTPSGSSQYFGGPAE